MAGVCGSLCYLAGPLLGQKTSLAVVKEGGPGTWCHHNNKDPGGAFKISRLIIARASMDYKLLPSEPSVKARAMATSVRLQGATKGLATPSTLCLSSAEESQQNYFRSPAWSVWILFISKHRGGMKRGRAAYLPPL